MNDDRLITVIPVRAGSKGVSGKNVRLIRGVPLYMHAVNQGLRVTGRVLISTDIEEIQQQNVPDGCEVCPRPSRLAKDNTPMASVINHLIESMSLWGSTIVLLQATTPLREDNDIRAAIRLYEQGRHKLVMSVVERDSGVLKYGLLDGSDFSALNDPSFCFANRQQLPPVYSPNGAVYVFSAEDFKKVGGFPENDIGAIEMPRERSVDIDNIHDFDVVERKMVLGSNQ